MSETKGKKSDARGVAKAGLSAETQPSSAAEAPGGHSRHGTTSPAVLARHDSPGDVGVSTCDTEHSPDKPPLVPGTEADLSLEQFVFTITPNDLPPGDYQDCWHPDTYMAFWDHADLIVADCHSDTRWRVIAWEAQRRASSRQYYTWFCERIGATDPCDEDFMREISS